MDGTACTSCANSGYQALLSHFSEHLGLRLHDQLVQTEVVQINKLYREAGKIEGITAEIHNPTSKHTQENNIHVAFYPFLSTFCI